MILKIKQILSASLTRVEIFELKSEMFQLDSKFKLMMWLGYHKLCMEISKRFLKLVQWLLQPEQ